MSLSYQELVFCCISPTESLKFDEDEKQQCSQMCRAFSGDLCFPFRICWCEISRFLIWFEWSRFTCAPKTGWNWNLSDFFLLLGQAHYWSTFVAIVADVCICTEWGNISMQNRNSSSITTLSCNSSPWPAVLRSNMGTPGWGKKTDIWINSCRRLAKRKAAKAHLLSNCEQGKCYWCCLMCSSESLICSIPFSKWRFGGGKKKKA